MQKKKPIVRLKEAEKLIGGRSISKELDKRMTRLMKKRKR